MELSQSCIPATSLPEKNLPWWFVFQSPAVCIPSSWLFSVRRGIAMWATSCHVGREEGKLPPCHFHQWNYACGRWTWNHFTPSLALLHPLPQPKWLFPRNDLHRGRRGCRKTSIPNTCGQRQIGNNSRDSFGWAPSVHAIPQGCWVLFFGAAWHWFQSSFCLYRWCSELLVGYVFHRWALEICFLKCSLEVQWLKYWLNASGHLTIMHSPRKDQDQLVYAKRVLLFGRTGGKNSETIFFLCDFELL